MSSPTLLDFFEHTYLPRRLLGRSLGTVDQYRLTIARFGGHRPVSSLSEDALMTFAAERLRSDEPTGRLRTDFTLIPASRTRHMRIRTLKPEFWSHPVMARLPAETQLLAIGLLNYADDEGYFFADPHLVQAALRPFMEASAPTHGALTESSVSPHGALIEPSRTVQRMLIQLSHAGWIELIEHPTHGQIGRVTNFTTHQRINRPTQSKIKTYWLTESSVSPHGALTEPSLSPHHRNREQGTGNREQGECARAHVDAMSSVVDGKNGERNDYVSKGGRPRTPPEFDEHLGSIFDDLARLSKEIRPDWVNLRRTRQRLVLIGERLDEGLTAEDLTTGWRWFLTSPRSGHIRERGTDIDTFLGVKCAAYCELARAPNAYQPLTNGEPDPEEEWQKLKQRWREKYKGEPVEQR